MSNSTSSPQGKIHFAPLKEQQNTWIPYPLDHVGHRSKLFQPAVLVGGWQVRLWGERCLNLNNLAPFFAWKVNEIKQIITLMQRQDWIIDIFHQQNVDGDEKRNIKKVIALENKSKQLQQLTWETCFFFLSFLHRLVGYVMDQGGIWTCTFFPCKLCDPQFG